METFTSTESRTFKLLRHDKATGIRYYEGGWWMTEKTFYDLDYDRFQRDYYNPKRNSDLRVVPRPNYETKEIELDQFLLPHTT